MFSRMNQSPVYPVSHFRQAQICFAMAKQVCAITTAIISIALMGVSTKSAYADDRFASSIFSTTGNFNNGLYRTPEALLGKPTTYVKDQFPGPGGTMNGTVAASMVFAAYNTDPSGGKLITTINTNEQITVKFDTPIVRDASHWFG
ncbi:MAG: hypothetical protein EOO39_37945 [Cytophagaceae bacterium]|nr:MAG: hypothetical protein EOO39_37945 [Cytophagaceae bacterium]